MGVELIVWVYGILIGLHMVRLGFGCSGGLKILWFNMYNNYRKPKSYVAVNSKYCTYNTVLMLLFSYSLFNVLFKLYVLFEL